VYFVVDGWESDDTVFPGIINSPSGDSVSAESNRDVGIATFISLSDPSGKAIGSNGIVNYNSSKWPGISWGAQNVPVGSRQLGGYTASVPLVQTEILKVQSKSAVPSGVFHDPNASGGAGTYLASTAPGQFVTYTVPVTAGYYKVRAGVNSNYDKGIFQLSIDGVNQGAPQDEYSATSSFGFRDLGTISVFDGQNKAFTFTVTGKNAKSTGYKLRFDWIDLIPISSSGLETEWFNVQAITPPPAGTPLTQWFGTFNAAAASNGAGTYFNANSSGQFITYTVPVITGQVYQIVAGVQTKPNKGRFQLTIDGLKQGLIQDEYSPTTGYAERTLGAAYLDPGSQPFTFMVTGKNPNSTDYRLAFDYIGLIPTDRYEAESLTVLRRSAVPTGVFTTASGGAGTYFNATAPGQSITFQVRSGGSVVFISIQTKPNKGKFRVAVNGVDQGVEIDGYSPTVGETLADEWIYIPYGTAEVTFTVSGKNPSSTGYTLAFDYIWLQQ
jgi:hypothetical protein